ncbi:hypothetical protein TrCOL_g13389 [Triparma columacea]|uniref:Uncharacterized protein n=1 Tax=Triparma columacea TaxID=722753 RepID=A0A9W7GDR4_9STRA|nr:hypothetical protein TrCOL_g13389 [Triparma columacea]
MNPQQTHSTAGSSRKRSKNRSRSSITGTDDPPPPPSVSSNTSTGNSTSEFDEPEDMNSLLSFYRKQCENNEKQIADLVQSISDLDPAYEELSKSRLEAEKKTSEITRLHNYASGLNSAIIEEKEKSLSLQGEVERLKVVEMELSKENSSLLDKIGGGRGITREEVTFYRDCRPERLRRHQPQPNLPDSPSRINSADASTLASPARSMRGRLGPQATGASSSSSIPGPNTPGSAPSTPTRSKRTPVHHAHTAHNTSRQVLRTVYLPNERADALVLMVESLSSQLEEHKNRATHSRARALSSGRAKTGRRFLNKLLDSP